MRSSCANTAVGNFARLSAKHAVGALRARRLWVSAGEQRERQPAALLQRGGWLRCRDHESVHAGLSRRGLERLLAPAEVADVERPDQLGDPAMPKVCEVPRGETRAEAVVACDRREAAAREGADRQHERDAPCDFLEDREVVGAGRRRDDGVDPASQEVIEHAATTRSRVWTLTCHARAGVEGMRDGRRMHARRLCHVLERHLEHTVIHAFERSGRGPTARATIVNPQLS
jgi:hypothetical protein